MLHSDTSETNDADSLANASRSELGQDSMTSALQVEREYLASPHVLMLLGGWGALFTVGAALAGAWLAPYNAKVQAPAVIRPVEELISAPGREVVPGSEVETAAHSPWAIKAWIPNRNINRVELGQSVQMRLQSCPYPSYGVLRGEVSQIATDTTTASVPAALKAPLPQSGSAVGHYEVLIQPNAGVLETAEGRGCELRAGMEGRVDILIGQERLLSHLMRQLR